MIIKRIPLLLLLSLFGFVFGQVKYEGEKQANTTTDYIQDLPDVKVDSLGNFVMVWQSYFHPGSTNQWYTVIARMFDSTGTALTDEIMVDADANSKNQRTPKVALTPDGGFIVTWAQLSYDDTLAYDIYARRFDSSGNPIGSSFKVNTQDSLNQAYPDISSDDGGNFVIVWEHQNNPDSTYDIYAQRFDSTGAPIDSNFIVNTYTTNDQTKPAVSMNDVGNFAIGWQSMEQDNSQWGVYFQRYNADGTKFGGEIRANSYTPNYQRDIDVALNNNDYLAVVWQSAPGPIDGSDYGVYAKLYSNTGASRWSDGMLINNYTDNDQRRPYVDMDDQNQFLVVWESYLQDGSGKGVYARRVDQDGNFISDEFRVNTITTNDQYAGIPAIRDGGDFVIAFSSYVEPDLVRYDVKYQVYRMSPVFSALPQKSFDEDNVLTYPVSDYFPYVDDENDADETLSWQTFNGQHTTTAIANDSVSVTPEANWFGTDSFMVVVMDPDGLTDTTYQVVVVNSVNDIPVAANDSATTDEDNAVEIAVLSNDSDADGDTLTVTQVSTPANGSAQINNGTTVTYTPDANFFGSDSFTYIVDDGNGGTDTATVNVTVNSVNDPPVAVDDSETTDEDNAVEIAVLTNDSDVENDALTVTSVTTPSNGTAVINNGTTVTYTPDANYYGSDSFDYVIDDGNGGQDTATVTITVNSINDIPVAVDDNATTDEDNAVEVDVLANDSDADNDALTITEVSTPANGTAQINGGSSVTYTPNANYYGSDSFNYVVSDGNGGTDTATVNVTVNSVNDAPVAVDDNATTDEEVAVEITVLSNDSDVENDPLTVTDVTTPANGTAVINSGTTVTYTPNTDFFGADSFDYTISDGNGGTATARVHVTVNNINDKPVAVDDQSSTLEETTVSINVLANDSDADNDDLTITKTWGQQHGSVTIEGGGSSISYTPDQNFFGTDSFNYEISDGNGGLDTAKVTVTITNQNDPPVAVDDSASTPEDNAVVVSVLDNDYDPDQETISVTGVTTPQNGTAEISGNGSTVTYTPNANFFGADSFMYWIEDGLSNQDSAMVYVTVTSVNDVPVAVDDNAQTSEEAAVTVYVLDNDSDIDNDVLTVISVTVPSHGTAVIVGDTAVTYTPETNFFGADSFDYTISDGNGGEASATVAISISSENDVPVAVNDTVQTAEETPLLVRVLENDYDADGDHLTVIGVAMPQNGTATVSGDSAVLYTPHNNFNGNDQFNYLINDGNGGTAQATIYVTVTPENDAPVISALPALNFDEDDSLSYLISNWYAYVEDADNPDSTLMYSVIDGKSVTAADKDSVFLFKAPQDWFGTDTLQLVVSDGSLADTADFIVTVNSVNDAPQIVGLPDSLMFNDTSSVVLNMTDYELDVDTPTSGLTWSFEKNNDSLLVSYDSDSKELTLSALVFDGKVELVCTLTDDSSASDVDTIVVRVKKVTAIGEEDLLAGIPKVYSLSQNYPNPFNPSTKIKVGLPKAGKMRIVVFNILGQRVATLWDGYKAAGYHVFTFDASRLTSGIYFYRIETEKFTQVKKMVLMK